MCPLGGSSTLTVIMPHFRCPAYLPAAVASVLGQTHRDLRLVVVDDCSPDDDWAAALTPFWDDPRLTVLRATRNVGPWRLDNAVLEAVGSRYVAFHDADDESEPTRFAHQLAVLERGRADLVGTGYTMIDTDGRPRGVRFMPRNGNLLRRLGRKTVALHPTTMVRRTVLSQLGGFDGTAAFGADTDFHLRVAWLYRIRNLRKPLYRYRCRPDSLTAAPETRFGSPARVAYTARMVAEERRRRQAGSRKERLPLLLAPANDVRFELERLR